MEGLCLIGTSKSQLTASPMGEALTQAELSVGGLRQVLIGQVLVRALLTGRSSLCYESARGPPNAEPQLCKGEF